MYTITAQDSDNVPRETAQCATFAAAKRTARHLALKHNRSAHAPVFCGKPSDWAVGGGDDDDTPPVLAGYDCGGALHVTITGRA